MHKKKPPARHDVDVKISCAPRDACALSITSLSFFLSSNRKHHCPCARAVTLLKPLNKFFTCIVIQRKTRILPLFPGSDDIKCFKFLFYQNSTIFPTFFKFRSINRKRTILPTAHSRTANSAQLLNSQTRAFTGITIIVDLNRK